jgi:hypothetical protein
MQTCSAALCVHGNPTIYHWYKMSVSDKIQYGARPRPIYTAKQYITVEGCPESFLFNNTVFQRVDYA